MSDNRYSHIIKSNQRYYYENVDVIVEAFALLKDNKTENVIAQAKFTNISDKTIKALFVNVECKNVDDEVLESVKSFQYLDLSVERNIQFGQKTPIHIPDKTTRNISIQIEKVIYADRTSEEVVKTIPIIIEEQKTLKEYFDNSEIANQFVRETNSYAKYEPIEDEHIWLCSCGAINKKNESKCKKCSLSFGEQIELLDKSLLEKGLNKYKAEKEEIKRKAEEEKAENEAIVNKKKMRDAIVFTLIMVVIVGVILISMFISKNAKYNKAVQFAKSHEYEQAIQSFTEIIDYKDSETQLNAVCYAFATELLEDGNVLPAVRYYFEVGEYKDAHEIIKEILIDYNSRKISAGSYHTVGLKSDGTIVSTEYDGKYYRKQCEVQGWNDLISVSTGVNHTVGLNILL